MARGLPWKQTLFIVVLYILSFATFYWTFYTLGFTIDFIVQGIILLSSLGLSFFVYNIILKMSRTIYTDEMEKGRAEAKAYGSEDLIPPDPIFEEIEDDKEKIPKVE